MKRYYYEAMNSIGQNVNGYVNANNSEDAISKVRTMGKFPTKIKEETIKEVVHKNDNSKKDKKKKDNEKIQKRLSHKLDMLVKKIERCGFDIQAEWTDEYGGLQWVSKGVRLYIREK